MLISYEIVCRTLLFNEQIAIVKLPHIDIVSATEPAVPNQLSGIVHDDNVTDWRVFCAKP